MSTEALSLERKYQIMKLTMHPQLELRLKILCSYTSNLHMPSGQAQEQLYLYNAAC
jgi:hypothetical protein